MRPMDALAWPSLSPLDVAPTVALGVPATVPPAIPPTPGLVAREHGGPDALGVPRYDFSTCSNACGPCPMALAALQQADARHYPDAAYAQLRAQLARFHGVEPARVLLAASASEFIQRVTAVVAQRAGIAVCQAAGRATSQPPAAGVAPERPNAPPQNIAATVFVPPQAYGDYAHAAAAWGLTRVVRPDDAALVWACEPSSPLGQAHTDWPADALGQSPLDGSSDGPMPLTVLDSVYAPLRLSGAPTLTEHQRDRVWQLFSPNKALGLTGIRASYVIAPCAIVTRAQGQMDAWIAALNRCAPSWSVGAHGVALLQAWTTPEVQAWLSQSLDTLREWKARQTQLLTRQGWQVASSQANYFCARAPQHIDPAALRQVHGIKLRDCTSLGLPGWVRLGVLGPDAQAALQQALSARVPCSGAPLCDGVPK